MVSLLWLDAYTVMMTGRSLKVSCHCNPLFPVVNISYPVQCSQQKDKNLSFSLPPNACDKKVNKNLNTIIIVSFKW